MAGEKCKMAFLALAFACLMQNAVAAPLAGGEKFSVPPELDIIGHAFAEIGKSISDLVKSLVLIVSREVAGGMTNLGISLYFKAHVALTAAGVQDSSLILTDEQFFEYRVVASTLQRLRQKLDVMERFEEVYESILANVAASFFATLANPRTVPRDSSPAKIFSPLILSFGETADHLLRQHPELGEVYLRTREVARIEEAKVKPFLVSITQASPDSQSRLQTVPTEINTKMLKIVTNKQFLHHTVNRFTILKKEYFVEARSTLELAKKRNKVDLVQRVYDKTLDEASSYIDPDKADVFDVSKKLFKSLKKNFEANPPLNQEWREIQRYVSQRHEWDRSIWDLDLIPF